MKFTRMIKMVLATSACLTLFSVAYAGDADIYGDVNQEIDLHTIELDSTSGEAVIFIGSMAAYEASDVYGDLDVAITTRGIDLDTYGGKLDLAIGGVSAGGQIK